MSQFIEVLLPLHLDKSFTYSVSPEQAAVLGPGIRVVVPFGKNKLYTALALGVHHNAPELYQAKPIHEILDTRPIVSPEQWRLWQWISNYYMCTIGEVLRAAAPGGMFVESETLISWNTEKETLIEELPESAQLVYQALQRSSILKISEVAVLIDRKNAMPLINSMLEKQWIKLHESLEKGYVPKQVKYVRLSELYQGAQGLKQALEIANRSVRQKELLMHYFQLQAQYKEISSKQLQEVSGAGAAIVKALVDKGIFEFYYKDVDRVGAHGEAAGAAVELTAAQDQAYQSIVQHWDSHDTVLLHGVTGSGKTAIYIRLIEDVIATGKQVLFLVPEIVLTAQLTQRLSSYFGDKVAVYHSRYTAHERVEIWNRILNNQPNAQIVIGSRSALLLPFSDLALLIVDEEHEAAYKQQDPAPRYNARDGAVVLAQFHQAKILLGSATPSLESAYNAHQKKYGFVYLKERYQNVKMPKFQLVDLKEAYAKKRMKGHFTKDLIEAIERVLAEKKQVVLFQNRRGYAPVLECHTCGHVPQCTYCDVSLTYHRHKSQLRCHYCGYSIAYPKRCHKCGSLELSTKGFGTEQIELELKELLPDARVLRLDQDTTQGKNSFQRYIEQFHQGMADILVGTQMLSKGLDFPQVKLVGVLNADNLLYYPDFRAEERAFQLLTQVAGRGGRSDEQGEVMVQTYMPEHGVIQQVVAYDYWAMYSVQLAERKLHGYPPFVKLIRITLKHRNPQLVEDAGKWMSNGLRHIPSLQVLGPVEPAIARVRNEYLREILVKFSPQVSANNIKKAIHQLVDSFETIGAYRSVRVIIQVDVY